MKKIFLLLALFVSTQSFAQNIQTYSGNYTLKSSGSDIGPEYFKGKSTYAYYENDDYERIYNGKFNYSGSRSGNGILLKISIKGKYKEGLKNGGFVTSVVLKQGYESATVTCKSNYSKGYANGLWSIYATGTDVSKNESISMNFLKNVGIGDFNIDIVKLSIKGEMDDEGYLDGKVIFNEGKWETIITYDHGFMLKYISRNVETGEFGDKEFADPIELENYKKIQEALKNGDTSVLENIPFRVENTYHSGIEQNCSKYFKDYNIPSSLPGDLSASDGYPYKYLWSVFRVKNLIAQETKTERLEKERLKLEKERLAQEKAMKDEIARLIKSEKYEDASKLYNEQELFKDDNLSNQIFKGILSKLIKSEKYEDASKLYSERELFKDHNLRVQIFNGLSKLYNSDTISYNDKAVIENYLKNNLEKLKTWSDGAYVVRFDISGLASNHVEMGKINKIPKKDINGFSIPLNSKLNFNIETTTELVHLNFLSGYKKSLYNSNNEKFYTKTSTGLPELKFEYDKSISKKMVKVVKTSKSTKRANGLTVEVKDFSDEEEKKILKKE